MTRLALVSDCHLGNHKRHGGPVVAGLNARCEQVLAVFAAALAKAREEKCSHFIVCGDLLDTSNPAPQLLARVLDLLRRNSDSMEWQRMEVVLLMGNHEMHSTDKGDHALGCLVDYAMVITTPTVLSLDPETDLLLVPYRPGASAAEWLPDVVEGMVSENSEHVVAGAKAPKRLLAVHLGIADGDTPPWLVGAHDSISVDELAAVMEGNGIVAAFAGNWHDGCTWAEEPPVFQIGALVPTGWDNPGLAGYGGMVVYNTDNDQWVKLEIPGPRFLKLKAGDALPNDPRPQPALYVQVEVSPDDVPAQAVAMGALVASKKIAAFDIEINRAEATAMAKTAAHCARSAETFSEALAAFLRTTPIPSGVDRLAVAARTCAYLGK